MNATIVIPTIEGLLSDDVLPVVYKGHVNLEQAIKIAKLYEVVYPSMACVQTDNGFYANFSNVEDPPRREDGTIDSEYAGHLELWFYHTELKELDTITKEYEESIQKANEYQKKLYEQRQASKQTKVLKLVEETYKRTRKFLHQFWAR